MNDDSAAAPATSPVSPPSLAQYRWPGQHQYAPVQPAGSPRTESHGESHAEFPLDDTKVAPTSTTAAFSWRPFYLRRSVLAAFIVALILIIVVIESLLAVSNQSAGIATSDSGQHYLWTYGPTAVLTLVAAFWSRAEYQSKLVAPWIRLSEQHTDPRRTLLLDYVGRAQLSAWYRSLRNRDFTVSITTTVSILIKILIVISTGLITLSWTLVDRSHEPMPVLDGFVDSPVRLGDSSLAWYIMKGILEQNVTYPDGMSKDYAFQSVGGNISANTETRYTVDGLTNSLECQAADVVLTGARTENPRATQMAMNLTIMSPGCNMADAHLYSPAWQIYGHPGGVIGNTSITLFARFAQLQCDGTADNDNSGKRVLVMFGNLTYYTDFSRNVSDYTGRPVNPDVGVLNRSTQLLCFPTYTIARVEVVRNGTSTQHVTPVPGTSNRTLASVTPWAIMAAQFGNYENSIAEIGESYTSSVWTNVSDVPVDVDRIMDVAVPNQFGSVGDVTSLYDADRLQELATGYYRQMGAIIAKQALVGPVETEMTGSVSRNENRLVIRAWAAQWMAGLLVACIILTTVALFTVPTCGVLPRSPSTIPGIAAMILQSHDLVAGLRDSAAADEKSLGSFLRSSTSAFQSGVIHDTSSNQAHFAILKAQNDPGARAQTFPQTASKHLHPGVLHPVSRLILCMVLVGLIVALELMLRKSDNEDGLGDVGDDTYIHYTWTTIPALAFGTLAMIFSSVDFSVRSLAPYTALKQTVSTHVLMSLDFLDMSIPRAMYKEASLANIGAFTATSAFLVASLFTIFSGSLFQALSVPTTSSIALRANRSFDLNYVPVGADDQEPLLVSSLILESNLSFPRFTYNDLAFPQFVPTTSTTADSTTDLSAMSISAVVPALRAGMDCRLYDSSKIRTNLTLNYKIGFDAYDNPLGVYIDGEECGLIDPEESEMLRYNILISTYTNATYFGRGGSTGADPEGCSNIIFAWGKLDFTAEPVVQHIAAMGCNVTIQAVDVDATFTGPSLDIDLQKPPQARDDTIRTSPSVRSSFLGPLIGDYRYLSGINTAPNLLDPFFAHLTTSRWALPLPSLGNASATPAVAAAIQFHNNLIQAQSLAATRVPANTTNATLTHPTSPTANDAQPLYAANATAPAGRRRVVQDAASTRILEALLAAALLLLLASWALLPRQPVLPRAPGSIASVAALVAGGNVLPLLPGNAAWRSEGEVAAALGGGVGGRFWLGWGLVPDEEGRAVGGENENGVRRFGVFAVPAGEGGGMG